MICPRRNLYQDGRAQVQRFSGGASAAPALGRSKSAALAYTRRWWSILAMGAQSAAIDCILGRDPQVWVPHQPPPLASVLAEADIAPEPSRLG